jgi:disease resistance protein RPM1
MQIVWFANCAVYVPTRSYARLENFHFPIHLQDFANGEFSTGDLSLDHLASLRRLSVFLHLGKEKVDEDLLMKVQEKLRHEADVHPNHPSLQI